MGLGLVACGELLGDDRRAPAVEPVLDYVVENPAGGYTAWFGYRNRGGRELRKALGHDNRFTPAPGDRGQPVRFEPGRHAHVFRVDFPRGGIVWHLGDRSVTATANQRPVVRLTEPLTGTTLTEPGRITLKATARDPDGRVVRVVFYQDGVELGRDHEAPFAQIAAGLGSGTHRFHAVAFDNDGAPSLESNAVVVTVLGRNRSPQITLTSPVDGADYAATAAIQLSATATDPDGKVVRVEFFRDGVKCGEAAKPPYACVLSSVAPGPHVISAAATDDRGAVTLAAAVTIVVAADSAVPLVANFEPAEGFIPGSLDGQQGWAADGPATVVASPVYTGVQAVELAPRTPATVATRPLEAAPGSVVYLDFFARLAAGSSPETSGRLHTAAATVALVRREDGGEIQLWRDDGAGTGRWQGLQRILTLDPTGVTGWQRFTIREDQATRQWDFYVGGVMLAAGLPFVAGAPATEDGFSLSGSEQAVSALDEFCAVLDNPLFVDVDHDGMEDAWEVAHGLDPTRDDREADADGDGLSNIAEYVLGTDPSSADTDGDGMPDLWEAGHGLDAAMDDAAGDPDHDGVGNLVEFQQGRDPSKGAIADRTGAVGLRLFQPGG